VAERAYEVLLGEIPVDSALEERGGSGAMPHRRSARHFGG
jgi:hypothetical protein